MLAIHNYFTFILTPANVANAYAKLSKCQQFTTKVCCVFLKAALQTLMQSYQNVSNSQPAKFKYIIRYCCKRLCKVIKMLAIHNQESPPNLYVKVANAYAKLSKCQQFTTDLCFHNSSVLLQTLMQSYQNVSNSQPRIYERYCF